MLSYKPQDWIQQFLKASLGVPIHNNLPPILFQLDASWNSLNSGEYSKKLLYLFFWSQPPKEL